MENKTRVVGKCFICSKDCHTKTIYDGGKRAHVYDWRKLPKDNTHNKEGKEIIHERCGAGSKNWALRFPENEMAQQLYAGTINQKPIKERMRMGNKVTLEELTDAVADINALGFEVPLKSTGSEKTIIEEIKKNIDEGALGPNDEGMLKEETWSTLLAIGVLDDDEELKTIAETKNQNIKEINTMAKITIGTTVKYQDETGVCTITAIDGANCTIEDAAGESYDVELADCVEVEVKAATTKKAVKKAVAKKKATTTKKTEGAKRDEFNCKIGSKRSDILALLKKGTHSLAEAKAEIGISPDAALFARLEEEGWAFTERKNGAIKLEKA